MWSVTGRLVPDWNTVCSNIYVLCKGSTITDNQLYVFATDVATLPLSNSAIVIIPLIGMVDQSTEKVDQSIGKKKERKKKPAISYIFWMPEQF